MSNKYKRKLQKRETKLWQDIVLLLPVLFGLCIVPMIVLTHDYTIDFTQFEWFNKMPSTGQIDSFGYSKKCRSNHRWHCYRVLLLLLLLEANKQVSHDFHSLFCQYRQKNRHSFRDSSYHGDYFFCDKQIFRIGL